MNKILNIVVANKIDDYQIIINKGSSDYIENYMRFLVYQEGEIIIDPLTKKQLGKLEIPKGFFKVQHIQEYMTTLISELKRDTNPFSTLKFLHDEVDIEKDLLKRIKVGDSVKIINELT
ncbi:hypothetical protein A0O34_14310 [Chryseobacterium glaciei]|uniref:Uncharacterized protein n=1 Tax=Chryseobacterium glaciei TaxID=1685010 RepID=A0A172XX61_9FLAO|nr:hypothetical protein [Chryseobacterium glaciei]ANF51603.1 hypothetical protein A0O34_14310 [Chryseobacterium glaciei]